MSRPGAFVVVGAGPGLGASAAARFARAGYPVGLISRNAETLRQLSADLGSTGATTDFETADVTDELALSTALELLRARLGPIEAVLFSPRPSLGWIKPVVDTTPSDLENALALSVQAAASVVRAVVPDMRQRRSGSLLFTNGGAAVEPHRDRAVSGVAYAAESAYVRMLHDTVAADGVYAAQLTVVGPIGPGAKHAPEAVAEALWRMHTTREQALLVLR
ncbi:SDR family NAD(P)-dependent oxidoreductase [Arthrobacter russicus]|jgi:NADP-dependent 3-hydroxy acid dehydrogenase YdfG|uniref:NADP-dependent 3-hydroxy acid dehydrogenase YdfG n=1 Tax=Arthrobacter russicus TaxID=172040 RepID=A0ABU1J763_9MICC|nr:SDR family NAD(P)-dependent oxidoreductase [Arthrobacter russicus]MDR6268004.1 NADP-dependent 3-hydroxy acid dehydrogenase YdfG [Arthrobacter russicus]